MCFRVYPLQAERRNIDSEPESWRDEFVVSTVTFGLMIPSLISLRYCKSLKYDGWKPWVPSYVFSEKRWSNGRKTRRLNLQIRPLQSSDTAAVVSPLYYVPTPSPNQCSKHLRGTTSAAEDTSPEDSR